MECASEPGGIAAGTEPRSRRAAVYQDRPAPPPPDGRAFLCPDPAFPAARAPRGPFHQQQVRSLRRHARAAALAVFAVLALALPAAAQSVTTLVSNAGQSTTSAPTGDADRAQAFTTGAAGATLSSVEIISGDTEGDDMAVSLCTVDSSGYPTSSCTALTAPSSFASGTLVFTDPVSTTLAATTTYTLLITSPGGESLRLTNTPSNAEETGAAAGWTIANTYHIKNSANVWGPGGFTTSFLITIKGTLSTTNTAPTVANTIPNQTATAGTAFSHAFLANTFADTDTGDTLTYTATKSDDTALPSWLSFAAATRTFSGTPTAADVGTVSVKVTASDGNGGSVSDTFDIVVSAAAGVTVSKSALTVTEEDTTGNTYTVVLDTRPTANVTVTVAGHGGTDVTLTSFSFTSSTPFSSILTFTTANWNLAQTVTVKAGNDTDTTNDTVTLTHSAASTDSNYGGITIGSVVVTVADNDTANTAPTAADKTVTTGEDRAYAFTADDFGFDDDDAGATLASVTIVTPPALGTLALDGTAVMANDVVTAAEIDGDMLTFTPALDAHGAPYTTFTFTVNDGTVDSTSAYTMTIDVTDAPAPVCGVPDIAGAGRRQIWSGTVTVERIEFLGVVSYGFAEGHSAGTLLPSQSFFIGSNNYVIDAIAVAISGSMEFSLDGFVQLTDRENAAIRLHVCDGDYDFNTADETTNPIIWSTSLDWSPPVTSRTVYLSLPANNAATGEPAISGTAQVGQDLTADASLIMDTDGVPSSFTYQWVRVDADGLSNPADITDATDATYTLTAADAGKKIKVQVSFTDELSGEEERTSAAYPSSGTVTAASTTAPALTSVMVTSTPRKTTDTYGAREHIEFSMTFDAPVTVTGDPTFAFDLGGASTATYYAGSGIATLRFSHAVSGGSSGDRDTNGISWAANAIALNGGTIAGTDNAVAAILTHVAQSNLAAHKVDGRTTAVTPATVTVAVTSTPTSLADTYGFGETIVITVTASEAVEVEGDPEFEFSLTDMGGSANDVPATYDGTRSSPTTIVFTYTVQAGDRDNNGIWIGNHSRTFMLDANDRIRTASQQIDIDRSHPEYGTHAGHKVDGSLGAPTVPPDPTPPTLVSATATTLTIEWTHPGDGGSPLTRNFIEYRVEGTTDWTNWYRGETPTPVTRAVIRNLAAATAYDVRVHSRNAIGNSQWAQSATAFSTLANTAATGAPAITGAATAQVGRTLTAVTTGIMDADGLTSPTYTYQWIRVDPTGLSNEVDIPSATVATYTPTDADAGKTIKVRVTFDDDGGNTETLTSEVTRTVRAAGGVPNPPAALFVTVGVGQVVLVWSNPRDSAPYSHYEYRSSAGDMISPDAMWQQVLGSPGTLNTAYYQVVKGLTSGTTHTLQVRAVNAQGGSAPATVTATPVSQPSCTIDELGDRRLLWQGQLVAGVAPQGSWTVV